MVLTATAWQRNGQATLLRGTWWRDGGSVRERAERSLDDGATWILMFDIVFRTHQRGR